MIGCDDDCALQVIMKGSGRMTVNDETFVVKQYDIIFCGTDEARGLYNHGAGRCSGG